MTADKFSDDNEAVAHLADLVNGFLMSEDIDASMRRTLLIWLHRAFLSKAAVQALGDADLDIPESAADYLQEPQLEYEAKEGGRDAQ